MDKFNFVVRKEDNVFVSIIKQSGDMISNIGVNLDIYSILTTDEPTARQNFTLTGHLPSEMFDNLMSEAKEVV